MSLASISNVYAVRAHILWAENHRSSPDESLNAPLILEPPRRICAMDIAMLGIVIIFFGLCFAYAKACDRL